jgi:Arc/MetJ-type ribon-helix-helix transcriptional regulator
MESYVSHPAKSVGAKLTSSEYMEIQKLVDAGVYLNVSDFIRDAVREKLEFLKVVKVRDVNYKDAKKEVLGYFQSYREVYPHQVAEDLELDYNLVWKITEELKKEGRLKVIE